MQVKTALTVIAASPSAEVKRYQNTIISVVGAARRWLGAMGRGLGAFSQYEVELCQFRYFNPTSSSTECVTYTRMRGT